MASKRPAIRLMSVPPAAEGPSRSRNAVHLGPRDRLEGRLYVEGDLVVAGAVDGALETTGDVEIDGGGKVRGPVITRGRLFIGPRGSLDGDVRVGRLIVQDGADFSGNVTMIKAGDQTRTPAAQPPAAEAAPAASPDAPAPATEAIEAVASTPPAPKPPEPKGKRH